MEIIFGIGVFLFLLGYTFFAWRYQKAALIALYMALPLYLVRFDILGIPTTLLEAMIVLFLLSFAEKELRQKRASGFYKNLIVKNKTFFLLIILFAASAFFAASYSTNLVAALGVLKAYIIEPILVLIATYVLLIKKEDIQKLFAAMTIPVIIVSFYAIIQYVFEIQIPEGYLLPEKRATSIFPYPAALALYLTPLITIFIVHIFQKQQLKKTLPLFATALAFGVPALFLSKAEGGILALAVSLALYFLMHQKTRIIALVLAVVTIIGIVATPTIRDYAWNQLTFQTVSGEVRLALWEGTWNLLKDRPILGAGLASFPDLYPSYKLDRHVEILLYPHNIFLNFWVELGLFGLIVIIATLVIFFTKTIKGLKSQDEFQKNLALAAFIAMLGVIIYGLVDVPFFKNDLTIIFFLVIYIAFFLKKDTLGPNKN